MSADRRFERALPGILADLGAGQIDDYSPLLARTARTRQRPAWSFPERWLPMDLAVRPVPAVITPRRLVAVVALLLLASLVGIALLAGSRPTVPPPFGVARNGSIVFADLMHRIQVGDPITLKSKLIVSDGQNERPIVSPDGTHIAFLRSNGDGSDVVVTRFDGTDPVVLTAAPLREVTYFEWVPDSRSVVAVSAADQGQYDLASPGKPSTPAFAMPADGFNNVVGWVYRPPDGAEVAVLEQSGAGKAISVMKADGSGKRVIVTPQSLPNVDIMRSSSWSPDGSKLAFAASTTGNADYRAYIVNADGSGLRLLIPDEDRPVDEEVVGVWSPDSRSIVLQRWYNDGPSNGSVDPRPLTVVDVATGKAHEVGAQNLNGYTSYGWSPDGTSILEVPGDRKLIILVDPVSGKATETPFFASSAASWQRLVIP
jgi:Tol biopolymer transport system component